MTSEQGLRISATNNVLEHDFRLSPAHSSWAFPNNEELDESERREMCQYGDKSGHYKNGYYSSEPDTHNSQKDLRYKLDREMCQYGDKSGRYKNGYYSSEPDTPNSQKDLRHKLDRRGSRSRSHREYLYSRPNYARGRDGLSPLRSPHSRTARYNVMDMDNSQNYRFTRNRMTSQGQGNRRDRHFFAQSPKQRDEEWIVSDATGTPDEHQTLQDNTDEEGTPVLSKPSPTYEKKTWSRRRLYLPSENDGSDSDGNNVQTIFEDDPIKLARRQKDISYGKNTDVYRKYAVTVPREKRTGDQSVHPKTPQKFRKCSCRSWDGQVRVWKLRLYEWADKQDTSGDVQKTKDNSEDGEVVDSLSMEDVRNGSREDSLKEFENGPMHPPDSTSDIDEEPLNLEEDISFLDDLDFDLPGTQQT